MLTGILDATGRISAVARHASELAAWYDGAPPADGAPVPISTVVLRVADGESLARPVTVVSSEVPATPLVTTHSSALAAAVVALVIWRQRNRPDEDVQLKFAGHLCTIGPASAAVPDDMPPGAEMRARDKVFAGGGQGLALLLARAVLDHHRIGVGLIESPPDVIVLQFPKDRGLS
jgi:hypothetical protein